jgi:putative Ca2+/H+ antiporter (TMEM165/GDT1 family)
LHNFSIPDQHVDKDVPPKGQLLVEVTFPPSGAVRFFRPGEHCRFKLNLVFHDTGFFCMALQIDWKLFVSTFVLIFVAELPDKTAFATLMLATRKQPLAIFIGVAMAFVIRSVVAVSFGSALGLLPRQWVSIGTAVLFILSAFLMWRRKDHEEENFHLETQKSNFRELSGVLSSLFSLLSEVI